MCVCAKLWTMDWTNNLLQYFLIIGFCSTLINASIMGDECDWTGSGLTTTSINARGVTPVYLRCSAGRVTWLYPRGALRVLLRFPGQEKDFRACVKIRNANSAMARLFLEGPRSLLPLYSHGDGGNQAIRCFTSKHGQVAIYVEATEDDSINKKVFQMDYDLQPLPSGSRMYDTSEECRPCSREELAQAFCTSDLVTRGIIVGVENNRELEIAELKIKITKLIRHTTDDIYTKDIESNSITEDDEDTDGEKLNQVTLHVSQHCGVSHGLGEFVFMARRKLGHLSLQCAPRWEDWAMLVYKLTEENKAHCVLRS